MTDDHQKLREAIQRARKTTPASTVWCDGPLVCISQMALLQLADAAESTLPRTKMVEVWRVEYAEKHLGLGTWSPRVKALQNKGQAEAAVILLSNEEIFACVCVTGPHQQMVPDEQG